MAEARRILSEPEAIELALAEAAGWSSQWADGVYLALHDVRGRFPPEQDDLYQEWAAGLTGDTCLRLIAEAERIAGWIGASLDQQRRFIAACAGIYRLRLDDLLATPMHFGHA